MTADNMQIRALEYFYKRMQQTKNERKHIFIGTEDSTYETRKAAWKLTLLYHLELSPLVQIGIKSNKKQHLEHL